MTSYKRNEPVKKALQILRFLSDQKELVSVKEISIALEIPYGTVMCYLATLEDDGMVQIVGNCWELGMGMAMYWSKTREREEARQDKTIQNLKVIGAG